VSETGTATAKSPFTPRLNAALEIVMRHGEGFSEFERMWAWMARHSWGNWCSYAIKRDPPPLELPAEPDDRVKLFAFGSGVCEFCKRNAKQQVGIPKGWRWHRDCMALAYAHEAVQYGNAQEREWGRTVITEGGADVPALMPSGGRR
jgi:hypothetical protein